MNKETRNTVLYSLLTISLVGSYWLVRQDAKPFEPISHESMIEINEQASEGFEIDPHSDAVVAGNYRQ